MIPTNLVKEISQKKKKKKLVSFLMSHLGDPKIRPILL